MVLLVATTTKNRREPSQPRALVHGSRLAGHLCIPEWWLYGTPDFECSSSRAVSYTGSNWSSLAVALLLCQGAVKENKKKGGLKLPSHLVGGDNARQNAATNADVTREWAFFVNECGFDGLLDCGVQVAHYLLAHPAKHPRQIRNRKSARHPTALRPREQSSATEIHVASLQPHFNCPTRTHSASVRPHTYVTWGFEAEADTAGEAEFATSDTSSENPLLVLEDGWLLLVASFDLGKFSHDERYLCRKNTPQHHSAGPG